MLKKRFCSLLVVLYALCFCVASGLLQPGTFIICQAWWGGARERRLSPKLTEHRLFARFIPSPFTVLLNPHMAGFPRYCVHPAPTGHMASARQLQATAWASMPFSIGLPKIWQHSGVSVLPGTQRTMCWLFVEEVVAAVGCMTSDGPWKKESKVF